MFLTAPNTSQSNMRPVVNTHNLTLKNASANLFGPSVYLVRREKKARTENVSEGNL